MDIKDFLLDKYVELNDDKERVKFISEVLAFVAEANSRTVNALTEKNDFLNNKLGIARIEFKKKNEEIEKAKKTTIIDVKKRLQTTRDSVFVIAEMTAELDDKLNNKLNDDNYTKHSKTIMSNILAHVGEIYDDLVEVNLWDKKDDVPKRVLENVKMVNNDRNIDVKIEVENNEDSSKIKELVPIDIQEQTQEIKDEIKTEINEEVKTEVQDEIKTEIYEEIQEIKINSVMQKKKSKRLPKNNGNTVSNELNDAVENKEKKSKNTSEKKNKTTSKGESSGKKAKITNKKNETTSEVKKEQTIEQYDEQQMIIQLDES